LRYNRNKAATLFQPETAGCFFYVRLQDTARGKELQHDKQYFRLKKHFFRKRLAIL